ncbi:amino acid adenylation domain-containing protein [Streptomyces winkii]|uniref:amino acid adenylation domain-containing protein n=1 Tax=Streptomyces winkii TaxID=3051178 RepID=UPI0028D2E2AC|nr:amino acid adenylation domain-containing protein [Streptomyces sp. DSM 40971]
MSGHHRNLYEQFAAAAARHSEETALEVGGRELTYRQLRDAAEESAGRLVAANGGAVPRRVGLLSDRSLVSYVGYLAVLRAGATVVALNPDNPSGRNAAIAEASGIEFLIAEPHPATDELDVPRVTLEAGQAAAREAEPSAGEAPPPCPATLDDVAYIVFTSGSTGAPKGVPVLHRNAVTYVEYASTLYDVAPGSRCSQTFDLSFDGSVYDLFVTWSRGGTLVVPQRSQLLSPVAFINSARITHWWSVPSLISFAERLGTLRPGAMPTLRRSLFGGEPLHLASARQWRAAAPASTVDNLYGPTELTCTCTGYRLPDDPDAWPETPNGTVPIGSSYPTVEHLVLDEDGSPAADGELCFRGGQRFPGYLDPANNAGRFLSVDEEGGAVHIHSDDSPPGDRSWYRTGDRVSEADGVLVHLGRIDHQVHIRGYRIELGEIEALLRQQPEVRDAIVVAVEGRNGEQEIEAAVTASHDNTERMYRHLSAHLPSYMLPRRISTFEQLPLNPNGKIDRQALATALAHDRS